jgi:hypothetical protein
MQNHSNRIFVGIKTGERLREQLDSSKKSMKPFFNESNPDYLQLMQIGDNEYIGKVIESGISLEYLNNIFMNVKTMLKMIAPAFTFVDDAIKIIALAPMPARAYY